jgi:type I restriction enzyme S subunit
MGSEWEQHDIAQLISDGDLVINDGYRAKNSELSITGLPFARAQNINGGFQFDGADCFPIDNLKKVGIKISQPGDVVFTSKGTVGRFAFVRNDTPQFVYAPQLCFWRSQNPNKIDCKWLYYWMQSFEFYAQFKGVSGQTDMAEYVSLRDQRAMHINLPDINAQHRIAHILGTLDDKIELNRRMNRTLEQMAAAIFKSWFIDFDPVHAKANGDPTAGGLPPHIANLFPNTFQDSELGDIPSGWKAGKLSDIANNPRRTVDPSSVTTDTPYIGLQDMPRNCIALDAWGQAEDVSSTKSQFNEGEILFGKLRPYFHKVGIAPVAGVCSTDILILVEKVSEWHSFTLSLVSSKAFIDYTDTHSAGTKMPRINWKDMSKYPITLPSPQIAEAFQNHVSSIHNKIKSNIHESRTLAQLRDTLLPKLLSGELSLPEAESLAGEVGG